MSKSKSQITAEFIPCEVCFNRYRKQIESMLDQHFEEKEIARKYYSKFPPKMNENDVFLAVCRHQVHLKESRRRFVSLEQPLESPQEPIKANLHTLAQGLADIGMRTIEYYKEHPDEARKYLFMGTILNAQRVIIEEKKLRVEESQLKLNMAKFFGGFLKPKVDTTGALEGEEVENVEPRRIGRPRNSPRGNK